jgi:hypothetical protein
VCGLIGFHPKKAAIAAFVLGMHFTGMVICSNAPIDGGTLELCALLILALSPAEAFYRLGRDRSLSRRSVNFHWPVFLLLMAAGCFYTFAGINKIKDVGLHWPFVLHLENLASAALERSLFKWGRYSHPTVCYFNLAPWTSYLIGGPVTLVAEIGFLSVLFVPRWRLSLIVTMAVFHALVFAMAGINFVGTTFLLFLCFDWNMIVRKGELVVNSTNTTLCQALHGLKRWDRWGSLEVVESADTAHDLTFQDELGRVYVGLEAFYQVAARCPRLWAISVMSRIPVANYLLNQWVRRRYSIVDGPDTLQMPAAGSEVNPPVRMAG